MKFSNKILFVGRICLFLILVSLIIGTQQKELNKAKKESQYRYFDNISSKNYYYEDYNNNDDGIVLVEPYKSIIQTTARVALMQTKLSKNDQDLNRVMNLLDNVGHFLSKPGTLLKTIKLISITFTSILLSSVFFPETFRSLGHIFFANQANLLDIDFYIKNVNNVEEKFIVDLLMSKLDYNTIQERLGLSNDNPQCTLVSLCLSGDIMKRLSYPYSRTFIDKFSDPDNIDLSSLFNKENNYVKSFISGFVDQNCTSLRTNETCIANSIYLVVRYILNL